MPPLVTKTKVAVLGGGAGGLAAAFELTATPELRRRYDVTVYQLGWRLGGKGASGRNLERNDRIEEHGLHVWFGFYDNAFDMIQRCYDELGRPPGAPLATWREAFAPTNEIVLYEHWKDRWVSQRFLLPPNPRTPGREHDSSFLQVTDVSLRWIRRSFIRLVRERGDALGAAAHEGRAEEALAWAERLGVHLARRGGRSAEERRGSLLSRFLREFKDWLWERIVRRRVDDHELRLFFMMVDFWTAATTGVVEDRLLTRGFGAINDHELRAWLRGHGASELTLDNSPFLRAYYDLCFAYEDGDKSRPNMAAGKGLQALIRMVFMYKGGVVWKMQAGMGDVVFAPLYEVLARRGVRFRFFHRVTDLKLSPDKQSVAEIEVVPQVRLRGESYQPLIDVKGLPCWPSEPDWPQLEEGERLRRLSVNFEHQGNPLGMAPLTLRQTVDFDQVVLAIPVGALPPICGELAVHSARFKKMLDSAGTVMTHALQLWLSSPLRDGLGWPAYTDALISGFVPPLETYCNMNHLIPVESWDHDVRDIAYFCGVMTTSAAETREEAYERAKREALHYIKRDAGPLWSRSLRAGREFEWNVLVDPQQRRGEARLDAQYWRANFDPSDLYVATHAGSVKHRLRADESGFDNLVLAGDWTRNGICGGSVEAAVTSGMQAARALSGLPEHIPGEKGWLADD